MNTLKNIKLLLASASPRRKELISQLGFDVEQVKLRDVNETYPADLPPAEVASYLSLLKSSAYHLPLRPNEVLVTADTVVIADNRVLGKPADEAEARAMLRLLSDRTHLVVTGVTLATDRRGETFAVTTRVTFAPLTDEEIDYYITRYRPFDKAGAYGIQEWIGYIGISGIEGDYYNVMGLPLHQLYTRLKHIMQ